MPRPGKGAGEKAKDFKSAIKRLFREMNTFRVIVIIALVLAAVSSIMTIFTPNILSDLTDKISEGLVIKTDVFESLVTDVTGALNQENLSSIMTFDLGQENVEKIMADTSVDVSDKELLIKMIGDMRSGKTEEMFTYLSSMSDKFLGRIIKPSKEVSVNDKITFIKSMNGKVVIPESIASNLFSDKSYDGVLISSYDQAKVLEVLSSFSKNSEASEMYKAIDKMPNSVKNLVEPVMNMNKIKSIVLFLVCIYLVSAIFSYIQSISMTHVSNNFARSLRSKISKKINKLPLKYFDKHPIGDTLSIVTNDVDMIAQSMNNSLATLVSASTLFLGTIIMMFTTNAVMALTAIASSFLGFIFMFLVLGKSQKYFVARQKELGSLNGHIEEVYSGLNVVKTYNGKSLADEKFDSLNSNLCEASWKSHFLSGLMPPMMGFIGNFGYVAVCVVGALLAINGHISFGVIVAFITYVRLFTSPLSQIAQSMTNLQSVAAAGERVFEFLDEEQMKDESSFKNYLENKDVLGDIEFRNVTFTYDGNKEPTIKNFSAKAKAGQKIAIVGPTGAGKTTMVNLLMKFYDIDDGDILIDGISTRELTRDNIHKLFTMVLQDTWLFAGTVYENIVYNREDVSELDVREICKTVGLDHFIKTLPKGYDTDISDNDSVSSGQRQLLTIARGMIEDSPFLILDEATSNVDTRTEEIVQKAMDKLTEGKTSFIIAHRLSTIKNADLILVMKDGNIIETGNHEELMNKNGFYAELYNSQFEL